ncbi:hypothetical protein J3E68DRAFT_237626 [Trichoderma sp. SZMC 28012]
MHGYLSLMLCHVSVGLWMFTQARGGQLHTHKEGAYYGMSMQGRENFVLRSTEEAGLCSPGMKTRCGHVCISGDDGGGWCKSGEDDKAASYQPSPPLLF